MPHAIKNFSFFCTTLLITFTLLSACGGGSGGGDSSTSINTSAASLTVTVTSNGRTVTPQGDTYIVDDTSTVGLTCNMGCTVTTAFQAGTTVTATSTTPQSWTSRIDFDSAASNLELRVTTSDGSAITVRLRSSSMAGGSASWSLDGYAWTRTDSTQSAANGEYSMVVHSASTCESDPFQCGTVSVHWAGASTGTFTLVSQPDFSGMPGTAWLNVKATGGRVDDAAIPNCTPIVPVSNDLYYNTDYRASSGQIQITRGDDGLFRAHTASPITVFRLANSENQALCIRSIAAPAAATTMSLQLNGVY